MIRSALVAGALILSSQSLLGCRSAEISNTTRAAKDKKAKAEADKKQHQEFSEKAHGDALQRFIDVARPFVVNTTPVFSAHLDEVPLRVSPPPSVGKIDHSKAILKNGEGISTKSFDRRQTETLRSLRFAVRRAKGRYLQRVNPHFVLDELEAFLDEIEYRARTGRCDDCAAAVERSLPLLSDPIRYFGWSSLGAATALPQRWRKLSSRLDSFSFAFSEADKERFRSGVDAMNAASPAIEAYVTKVTEAPSTVWGGSPNGPFRRFPDILGKKELSKWLRLHEAVTDPAVELSNGIKRQLRATTQQLAHYKKQSDTAPTEGSKPIPPTQFSERCQKQWQSISRWASDHERFRAASLDCNHLASYWAATKPNETVATLDVIDTGLIEPTYRALRLKRPNLSIVGGEMTPRAMQHILRVVTLVATNQPRPLAQLLETTSRDLCAGQAALAVHGELESIADTKIWLKDNCPQFTPEQWIQHTKAHPMRSLRSLGLSQIARSPEHIAKTDDYHWLPLGLVQQFTRIELPNPVKVSQPEPENEDAPKVRVKIQEL